MPYASKYYDPQKAHEYYERTKKLKGYENRYGGSRGDGTSAASTSGYLSDYARQRQQIQAHNNRIAEQISQVSNTSNIDSEASARRTDIRVSTARELADVRQQIADAQRDYKQTMANLKQQYGGKVPKDIADHNKKEYKKQVAALRKRLKAIRENQRKQLEELAEKKREERLAKRDAAQRLRQQTRGGSTAGFNQKGKEAAAYIKKEIEKERDKLTKKTNSVLDKQMLSSVNKLARHIDALRRSGGNYSNADLLKQINGMSKKVAKAKKSISNSNKKEFVSRYKAEIDKLREDDSMFTYWDKRKESERAYQERKKTNELIRRLRNGSTGTGTASGTLLGNGSSRSSGRSTYRAFLSNRKRK